MIAVWFSCGAASAVAAKLTLEEYGQTHDVRIVNNPVVNEHPDNLRFLKDVEKWLGVTIEFATNEKYPACDIREVFAKHKIMSMRTGYAPCTHQLKKEARQQWEKRNYPNWHVLGFTVEEINRFNRFVKGERENTLPILIKAGITKERCFEIIQEAGIRLPEIYNLGYPNANCIGCVKATSPTYWNHVRQTFPDIFAQRAKQSREIGCRLTRYKGNRIFLDELPADAKGNKMKNLKNIECGIFCEEK